MALLGIGLLGGFTLTDGDQTSLLTSSQLQAFLSYLLIHRSTPLPRQQIAFVFWPDSTEKQARGNLRRVLHRLRQEWPAVEQYVEIGYHTVAWRQDADVELDVAQFETALASAAHAPDAASRLEHLRAAVELYRGELLPDCYDDWVIPARAQFEREYTAALEQLIGLLEQCEALPVAIRYAERLLAHEPFRETTYQTLIRLHIASGNRGSALAVYHECVSQLRAELDVEPSAATQQLYQEIVAEGASRRFAAGDNSVLVGRTEPWQQLAGLWRDIEMGHAPAQLALIEGEAGIGKTRLAQEFLDSIRRDGGVTAAAPCYAGHTDLAYAPLTYWLRSLPLGHVGDLWKVELARLVPEILADHAHLRAPPPMTEEWQRQRFYEALRHATTDHRSPALLLLDDIQWCDRETLAWLSYLLQGSRHARLLLVATLRREEAVDNPALGELLAVLERTGQLNHVPLRRLSREETGEVASALLGRPAERGWLDALYDNTEGVPLFVVEYTRSADASGDVARTIPAKVHAVLSRRFEQLSEPAQHAASVAAAIGKGFSVDVLRPACALPEDTLLRSLDELWAHQFLRQSRRREYHFSHDKLREVAYERVNATRREAIHGRIAEVLEAAHPENLDEISARLAHHFEIAGEDERAAAYYHRAAEAARHVYAHQEALEHVERALALDPCKLEYYVSKAAVLVTTGQAEEAVAVYADALRQCAASPLAQSRLYLQIGRAWLSQRCYAETEKALDTALQILGQPADGEDNAWRLLLRIQLQRAEYLYFTQELTQLRAVLHEVGTLIAQHGTARDQADYHHRASQLELVQHRFVATLQSVEHARRALEIVEALDDAHATAYGRFAVGFNCLWADRLQEAEAYLGAALDDARGVGNAVFENLCLSYLSVTLRKRGAVAEVRKMTRDGLRLTAQLGISNYAGMAQANRAWVRYVEGEWREARQHAVAAVSLMQAGQSPFEWLARLPLLAIELRDGEVEAAREQARALLAPGQQKLPDDLETALQQALAAANPDTGERQLREAISLAEDYALL